MYLTYSHCSLLKVNIVGGVLRTDCVCLKLYIDLILEMYILLLFYFLKFLAVLGLRCCTGFSLVAASGGYSLVAACRLLMAVASLVAEQGLCGGLLQNRDSRACKLQ